MKYLIAFVFFITSAHLLFGQQNSSDSSKSVATLKELFAICKSVNFSDPKAIELGAFYKAAPYIIYRGEDKNRAWKDFANYKNAIEKKGVDEICERINGTVNRDANFKIERYFTETESEGTWHVLVVNFNKKGVIKKAVFAFLKIGDRFALGDID